MVNYMGVEALKNIIIVTFPYGCSACMCADVYVAVNLPFAGGLV